MFKTMMIPPTASRSVRGHKSTSRFNVAALAVAVCGLTLFSPGISIAQHHHGGGHHMGGISSGHHHHHHHHSGYGGFGGYSGYGGYYGGSSLYGGGLYGSGLYGSSIGLGGIGIQSYGYPNYYATPGYYNLQYSGTRSYGAYSYPQNYGSSAVYSYGNNVPQPRMSEFAYPAPAGTVTGDPLNGELRPGMVLPDGAVVISVDPPRTPQAPPTPTPETPPAPESETPPAPQL